ncbi:hypothetical protein RND71_036421 [Anisodus tanguticus]|uniref:Squalene cyclase C-terminal domain-containing protein n=1 Tax=Anisodus tanguticus TaxID=243964 RepID=A0AAE1UU57_9SOLA|nr:hypothetical protein RND71_036421 [Anisodus tanguticus]
MEHIHYEDENSRYLCIDCVEKSFGCQLWDAAFSIQAILSSDIAQEFGPTIKKANSFLKESQVQENPYGDFKKMYRHISKGSWTFSMQDYGWQVPDCTSEGLKCALLLSQMPTDLVGEKIETHRIFDAVNIILSLQVIEINVASPTSSPKENILFKNKLQDINVHISYGLRQTIPEDSSSSPSALLPVNYEVCLNDQSLRTEQLISSTSHTLPMQSENGGFPAWEPQRAYRWLEKFNPTEFFEDAVIERE